MADGNPNEAGHLYVANVTLTEAVVFDPEKDDPNAPETWDVMAAEDFDKDSSEHKHLQFYCPHCIENDDKIRLKKPSGERIQPLPFEVVDPQTDEPILDEKGEPQIEFRRYLFPAHFSTWNGVDHTCDVVKHQQRLKDTLQDLDGIKLNPDEDVTILNLGIPAGQQKAQRRRPYVHLSNDQFNPNSQDTEPKRRLHTSRKKPPRKLSRGVSDVADLARVLDDTQFDEGKRQSIVLRNGSQLMSLEQLHNDNVLDMYRDLYVRENAIINDPDANHNHLALFRFRPNGNRKFWHREQDGSMTVPSHPEQVRDKDGHLFYVSARINFQTEGAFQEFEKAYSNAKTPDERWFLVYTENANIDPFDHLEKKARLQRGLDKHAEVGLDTTVFQSSQIMQWTPQSPQLEINFGQTKPAPNDEGLEMA